MSVKSAEALPYYMELHIHLGTGTICHLKDNVTVAGLLQGALKSLDQMVGKLSDKTYCIRQKDLLPV